MQKQTSEQARWQLCCLRWGQENDTNNAKLVLICIEQRGGLLVTNTEPPCGAAGASEDEQGSTRKDASSQQWRAATASV